MRATIIACALASTVLLACGGEPEPRVAEAAPATAGGEREAEALEPEETPGPEPVTVPSTTPVQCLSPPSRGPS